MVEETRHSLTEYLREVVEWRYSEFLKVENDEDRYTSDEGAVLALIRAICNRKLPAIKEAIDRLDGRQAAVTEVIYPTFRMIYPRAKAKEHLAKISDDSTAAKQLTAPEETEPVMEEAEPEVVATGSIRDTIIKMGMNPRSLVTVILAAKDELDKLHYGNLGDESQYGDPKVKSVIAATLHDMARRGDLKAIFEVLDQIDGKIANKIEIKGEDVEMVSYDLIAPANAERNADGVYEVVMPQLTGSWQIALDPNADNARRFGDGR